MIDNLSGYSRGDGLLYLNKQAVWASAVMASSEMQSYRMVGDFRAVDKVIKKSPGVMIACTGWAQPLLAN